MRLWSPRNYVILFSYSVSILTDRSLRPEATKNAEKGEKIRTARVLESGDEEGLPSGAHYSMLGRHDGRAWQCFDALLTMRHVQISGHDLTVNPVKIQ
jgi:hypothetical protein